MTPCCSNLEATGKLLRLRVWKSSSDFGIGCGISKTDAKTDVAVAVELLLRMMACEEWKQIMTIVCVCFAGHKESWEEKNFSFYSLGVWVWKILCQIQHQTGFLPNPGMNFAEWLTPVMFSKVWWKAVVLCHEKYYIYLLCVHSVSAPVDKFTGVSIMHVQKSILPWVSVSGSCYV